MSKRAYLNSTKQKIRGGLCSHFFLARNHKKRLDFNGVNKKCVSMARPA